MKNYKNILPFLALIILPTIMTEPKAKTVIKKMDAIISQHIAWNNWTAWNTLMKQFFTEDMIYDTNWTPNQDLGNSTGIREWYNREHIPYNLAFDNSTFNQLIFASEETTATTTTYALARWKGQLAKIPPTNQTTRIRIFDFYLMGGENNDKIFYNWMLLDIVHLMLQAGYRVLPKPFLVEGISLPPSAMDGTPAPISRYTDPKMGKLAKEIARSVLYHDFIDGMGDASPYWPEKMTWYGPVGFGMATSRYEYEEYFLKELHFAFTKKSLVIDVLTCEGNYCGAHGYLHAFHSGEWLGEPASNKFVKLRFGLHWRTDVKQQLVHEGWTIFDLPAFFIQIGVNLYDRMKEN